MGKVVAFVGGKDPQASLGGGPSYMRAHVMAAMRAGFEPHIFYGAPVAEVVACEYGFIHKARVPPFADFVVNGGIEFNKLLVGLRGPRVAAEVARFLSARPGPHLIHGFSTWGYTALLAGDRLRRAGFDPIVANSVYTTMENETRMKAALMVHYAGSWKRALFRIEYALAKRTVARYEGRIFADSRLVLLNYESVHRLYLGEYGPGAPVRKLPYAAEAAFIHEGSAPLPPMPDAIAALAPRDAPLIVTVSRHDPRKGIDVLLHALGALKARGVRFRACVTSGGILLANHRQLITRLGLAESVAATGFVPDPFPYLRHADIFVLPSLQEASGAVSLAEAVQAGAAVVASGIDGIPEDVADGDSALLVPPGDPAALSRALERVLTDAALRERLRRRARETFVEKFSAAAFTEAIRTTYEELTTESSQRR
jgi:glycosyltransferase involved in cell wall biosynthesis